jgi:hypothetical protein
MNRKQTVLTAFATIAPMSCSASGVTVSRIDYADQYVPAEASAAGGGDHQMKLVVWGNPFDVPQAALSDAVVGGIQGKTFGVPINFALEPANPDPSRPWRVVIAFNPEGMRDPARLCTLDGPPQTARNTGAPLTVMGAFCTTDSHLTHAVARSRAATGIDTPEFEALLSQLTLALFPDDNPNNRPDGDVSVPPAG